MPPARGDRKPCIVPECTGTMQFRRSNENAPGRNNPAQLRMDSATVAANPLRWICSREPDHFQKGN
jgi:hypothetical protein